MPDGIRPIVVDNGSTDGSGVVAARLGAWVIHEPSEGSGPRATRGFAPRPPKSSASWTPTAPAIRSTSRRWPRWSSGGDVDLVLGSREPDPGSWPAHARVANRYLAWRLRRRFGWAVTDLGPMRAAPRRRLQSLGHHRSTVGVATRDGPPRRRRRLAGRRDPGPLPPPRGPLEGDRNCPRHRPGRLGHAPPAASSGLSRPTRTAITARPVEAHR